jgi:hypothetical protein
MNDDYPYRSPSGTRLWQPGPLPARTADAPVLATAVELPADSPLLPRKLLVIVAVAIVIASVFNMSMVPVSRFIEPGPGFAFGLAYLSLVLGSLGGQAAVLTVLVVWGSGPLWLRLVWHWGLALVAFTAWAVGFVVGLSDRGLPYNSDEGLRMALFGLPLVALACQLAPWLMKVYFRWRIELEDEAEQPAAVHLLSIRDMLVGTIVVAVAMAAVRFGKPRDFPEGYYWIFWGIGSAAAAGISLVCLVPIVYLTLGVRGTRWGLAGVVAIAASVAAAASGVLMWVQPPGPSDKEVILIMTSIAAGFTLTLAGTLWIARAYGYRLVMGRVQSPDQWPG